MFTLIDDIVTFIKIVNNNIIIDIDNVIEIYNDFRE